MGPGAELRGPVAELRGPVAQVVKVGSTPWNRAVLALIHSGLVTLSTMRRRTVARNPGVLKIQVKK